MNSITSKSVRVDNERRTYFDKLRSGIVNHLASYKTKANVRNPVSNSPDNALENLLESIRSSPVSECNATVKDQSNLHLFRRISSDTNAIKIIHRKNVILRTREHHVNSIFSISTGDGDIVLDFSKPSIDYPIYLHLMQLVRSSNLDKLIEKIYHKSGYSKRRNM